MPYIPIRNRIAIDATLRLPATPGELNYKITRILLAYLGKTPDYERYNTVLGALEGVKLELYRRMVAPYEVRKMLANGDVYPPKGGNDVGLS